MIILTRIVRALLLLLIASIALSHMYIFICDDVIFGFSSLFASFVLFKIYFRRTVLLDGEFIRFVGVFWDMRVRMSDVAYVVVHGQPVWRNSYVMEFKLKDRLFKIYSADFKKEVLQAVEAAAFKTETNNFGITHYMS